MRLNFTFLFYLLISATGLSAQDTLFNGGFERWKGGYVLPGRSGATPGIEKCCGQALAVPTYWGIVEQLMQMPTNNFVYKEVDTAYIHSGYFSARLATDTTTRDSAGDVKDNVAVLVPGLVTCAGIVAYGSIGLSGNLYLTQAYSNGYPFNTNPTALNFYMYMSHQESDTARYAYAFTRWDSINMKEDTLAVNDVEIPDNNVPANQWVLFSDTIRYLLTGAPDTLHMIFFGGKNADINKLGNSTWLDDISFYYADSTTTPTGLVHMDIDDAIGVYPNPATSMLNVKADDYMKGDRWQAYDLTGNKVIEGYIQGANSSFDISHLANGVYFYRLLDKNARQIYNGKFTVGR
jgi:Secretion system C-terminal sorting domain